MSFDRTAFDNYIHGQALHYFTPAELLVKTSNVRGGVKNTPPPQGLWRNIVPTAKILDELRHRLGKPIVLHSTYRSPQYNRAISGARSSQHCEFRAIDFHVVGMTPKQVATVLKKMRDDGEFVGGIGTYAGFVHLDTRGYNATWNG